MFIKDARRLPLPFNLGLNLEAPFLNLFMKGVFKEVPPSVDDRMPKGGDVNLVLKWLFSKEFCLPKKANFVRLEQETFFLIQIGAGRRAHEICSLSIL